MQLYTTEELAELVGWSVSRVRTFAREGLLSASRRGRAYRFGFRDLALLKMAKTLMEQGVSYSRVRRSLRHLKQHLPEGRPLTALRVRGLGHTVLIEERGRLWEAESGQGQLPLEQGVEPRPVHCLAPAWHRLDALFERALELEEQDARRSAAIYQELIEKDSSQVEAVINLGRLLQTQVQLDEAAALYARVLDDERYGAVAHFNLGTVREEQGEIGQAIRLYTVAAEAGVTDAHYNLARLYELEGDRARALRHLLHLARSRGA